MGVFRSSNLQDEIPCGDPTDTIPCHTLAPISLHNGPQRQTAMQVPPTITKVQALSDPFDPLPMVRRP